MPKPKLVKAYNKQRFLHSADGRTVRMLCEYLEPQQRFRKEGVTDTIVFFGSSRARSLEVTQPELERIEREIAQGTPSDELTHCLEEAKRAVRLSRYYEDARELAKKVTNWTNGHSSKSQKYVVCSGGGPGIMEAADRGAQEAGGKSVGLCISLPHEQQANEYISPKLGFEFHYFFMRKYWFVYLAKALVVFPGGFGTLDEMFEVLTLVQTEKVTKPLTIVLYGSEYWDEVVDFDTMIRWGTISADDLHLFHVCDTPDQAFNTLVKTLKNNQSNQNSTL